MYNQSILECMDKKKFAFTKTNYILTAVGMVIIIIGLLLMFIFQSAAYGVLGRMIALSAIISFVVLYLFIRITITCTATIENKR